MKHTTPSRTRRQMRERVENASQPRPERAIPTVIAACGFDRPINQERSPHNGVAIHESPITAVLAVIAIVTHREILPRWNDNLVPLNMLADLRLPFRNRIGRDHLSAHGRKGVIEWVSKHRSVMDRIGLIQTLAVHLHISVNNLETIPGQTDNPFNEMLVVGVRVFENDD